MRRHFVVKMASTFLLIDIVFCASFFLGHTPRCTALQWSSGLKQDAVVYACAGGTLSLPWTVSNETGDAILNKEWFQHGESAGLIAVETNGNFLPVAAYSGRLQRTTNAGFDISHVTVTDSGNYSVEIMWQGTKQGGVQTLKSMVTAYITDDLQTSDGQLHLDLSPEAQYSNTTHEYHVVLRCGVFTYPTYPPYEVSWTTPSGFARSSSGYENGSFYLLLPNPVEGGSYICRVPPTEACLKDSSGEVTLTVDKMEARMSVMEARQVDLEKKNVALEGDKTEAEARMSSMEARQVELEKRNAALEAVSKRRVGFYVKIGSAKTVSEGAPIILPRVVTNQGNTYSGSSGQFTAPFDATYGFIASAETGDHAVRFGLHLMLDTTILDYVSSTSADHYAVGSVHAVIRLRAGQKVWLKNGIKTELWATSFSGFLISADPYSGIDCGMITANQSVYTLALIFREVMLLFTKDTLK